jgi:hypothetical protein
MDGMAFCAYDGRPAAFACRGCGLTVCERCTRSIMAERATVRVCPACGELVRPLASTKRNVSTESFWRTAVTAPVWPLSVRGLTVVVVNALFISLLWGAAYLLTFSYIVALLGLAVLLFAYGYLFLLFLRVVQRTALGEETAPSTPDMSGIGEAFVALLRMLVVLLVWTAPATIAYYAAGRQTGVVFWVLVAVGGAFLPMSLLAVATFESLRGVNPIPLLRMMARVPVQYALCCAVFYLVIGARYAVCDLESITGTTVLDVFVKQLAVVYSLYVAGRVLGALHASNSLRFGWVHA